MNKLDYECKDYKNLVKEFVMVYGEGKETIFNKIVFGVAIAALVLLSVVMSQPAWRGEAMLSEMRANCDKVGGVMLEKKQPVLGGSTYWCAERLDK